MKKTRKAALISILSILGIQGIQLSALAEVWKFTSPTTQKTSYYVDGQTPNSTVEVKLWRRTSKTLTLNNCGWGKTTISSTSVQTQAYYNDDSPGGAIPSNGGEEMAIANGSAAPTCTSNGSGGYTDSMASTPFNSAVKVGNVLWVKGASAAPGTYTVGLLNKIARQAKTNNCGIVRISAPSATATYTLQGFNVASAEVDDFDALQSKEILCRKDKTTGNGIKFMPSAPLGGTGLYKLDDGRAFVVGTPGSTVAINYPGTPTASNPTPADKITNAVINACGFKTISATTVARWGSNPKINGSTPSSWNESAKSASQLPYCRARDTKIFAPNNSWVTALGVS